MNNRYQRHSRTLLIACGLAFSLPALADEGIKAQVASARADCRVQQSRLQPLERNAKWCTDDQTLIRARDAAEASCGKAMKLMVVAGMEPKPVAPQPAPATPTLTVVEKVRLTSAQAAALPGAEIAALEMDRDCPGKSGRRTQ